MTGPCSSGHDNFDRSTPVEIVVPLFGISGGQRRKRAAPPIDYQYGDLDPYDGDEPCCGRVMPLPRGQGNRQDARSLRRFALHLVQKHFDLAAHEGAGGVQRSHRARTAPACGVGRQRRCAQRDAHHLDPGGGSSAGDLRMRLPWQPGPSRAPRIGVSPRSTVALRHQFARPQRMSAHTTGSSPSLDIAEGTFMAGNLSFPAWLRTDLCRPSTPIENQFPGAAPGRTRLTGVLLFEADLGVPVLERVRSGMRLVGEQHQSRRQAHDTS